MSDADMTDVDPNYSATPGTVVELHPEQDPDGDLYFTEIGARDSHRTWR